MGMSDCHAQCAGWQGKAGAQPPRLASAELSTRPRRQQPTSALHPKSYCPCEAHDLAILAICCIVLPSKYFFTFGCKFHKLIYLLLSAAQSAMIARFFIWRERLADKGCPRERFVTTRKNGNAVGRFGGSIPPLSAKWDLTTWLFMRFQSILASILHMFD